MGSVISLSDCCGWWVLNFCVSNGSSMWLRDLINPWDRMKKIQLSFAAITPLRLHALIALFNTFDWWGNQLGIQFRTANDPLAWGVVTKSLEKCSRWWESIPTSTLRVLLVISSNWCVGSVSRCDFELVGTIFIDIHGISTHASQREGILIGVPFLRWSIIILIEARFQAINGLQFEVSADSANVASRFASNDIRLTRGGRRRYEAFYCAYISGSKARHEERVLQ